MRSFLLAKLELLKFLGNAIVCVLFTLSITTSAIAQDSAKVFLEDSVAYSVIYESDSSEEFTDSKNVVYDSVAKILLEATTNAKIDSVAYEHMTYAAATDKKIKTVLYLGGGERSPWFSLGALYAIEAYNVPIDSIVATSWGAFVGALWARGLATDDIQKILLDKAIVNYVGKNLSDKKNAQVESLNISTFGVPALRERFSLEASSSGDIHKINKPLKIDSSFILYELAKLRFQESLYRQNQNYVVPFSLQSCKNGMPEISINSNANIIKSLPLWGSINNATLPGEYCPYYALPAEDSKNEFSIIVVSDPLRDSLIGDTKMILLKQYAALDLKNQPGVIVRAHSLNDTSRAYLIQAGFSALEKQVSEIFATGVTQHDYSSKRKAALPWFKFAPVFDSLPAQLHNPIKSYWNVLDTGIVAPKNFAFDVLKNPAYDSLNLNMSENGELSIGVVSHPTFDIAAGGFGSNALGANAYFEAGLYYVDQMEMSLIVGGFYGMRSFGVRPRLNVSRLWNKHWGMQLGFDYLKLRPLKSFNNEYARALQVLDETRSDFTMSLSFDIDLYQRLSAEFLLGRRTFGVDSSLYGDKKIKTYPVSPMLHYSYVFGDSCMWFSNNGFVLNVAAGFESIGFDLDISEVVPIYWKILTDIRYSMSPKPFATFTIGGAFAMERYHDEGHGYVSPRSFGFAPLDLAYRLHASATPWSSEWYNPELSSHEYALLKANVSLHSKYAGVWIFAAYFRDIERSPFAMLSRNKFIFEPALRFAYKSLTIYMGLSRIVDTKTFGDLNKFKDYSYFIKIGDYEF